MPAPARRRRSGGRAARRRTAVAGTPPRSRRLNSSSNCSRSAVRQRLQRRPRAGAGDPGEDGVVALQHVQVRRLPDVDRTARGGERVEVGRRRRGCRGRRRRRVLGVRRLGGQLGADRVAGLVEVAGHLEGEPAARRDLGHERRQQVEVVGHPLQRGVGDEHVDAALRGGPVPQVADGEVIAASPWSRRPPRPSRGWSRRRGRRRPGQRSASSAVRLPGPQPRSTTVRGSSAPIRATRSTKGRPRSSA